MKDNYTNDANVVRFANWINEFNGTPIDVNGYYITININSLAKKQELDGAGWTRLILFSDKVEKLYDVEWWKLREYQWRLIETFRPDLKEFITNNEDQYLLMREMDADNY